jgi:hypothetical protein
MTSTLDCAAEPRELALLTESVRLLAEAKTIDEVKDIRDKAEALRMYLKQQDAGLEAMNAAAEIKLRAERRAGKILLDMDLKRGRPSEEKMSHDVTFTPKTLDELGVSRKESSRWQKIARDISDDAFEKYVAETKESEKPITTEGALRLANQAKGKPPEPQHWTLVEAMGRLCEVLYEIYSHWPPEHLEVMARKLMDAGEELLECEELRS